MIHEKSRIHMYLYPLFWNKLYKIAAFYDKNLNILRQNKQENKLVNNMPISLLTHVKIFGSSNYYSVSIGLWSISPINGDARSVGSPNGLAQVSSDAKRFLKTPFTWEI